jgi:hypothetical protein
MKQKCIVLAENRLKEVEGGRDAGVGARAAQHDMRTRDDAGDENATAGWSTAEGHRGLGRRVGIHRRGSLFQYRRWNPQSWARTLKLPQLHDLLTDDGRATKVTKQCGNSETLIIFEFF